jgi:hypothetical protein
MSECMPSAMPVLSRGKHRKPSQGACFMEYTAVLAGEEFSHSPRCVDEELASVMRGANDRLSDDERAALAPLLGRAIGLAVPPPPADTTSDRSREARRRRRDERTQYRVETTRLRQAVTRRLLAAVGTPSPPDPWAERHGYVDEVAWLFWDLMDEPTQVRTSEEYVQRLLERLALLHECYESAMDQLGMARSVPVPTAPSTAPADQRARVG